MTSDPICCGPTTTLPEVARLMLERDCGCVPVVDQARRPLGVVTDRDVCCRAVARDLDTRQITVAEVMTRDCVTVSPDTSAEGCCALLEEYQIRRAVVVDDDGRLCGMIAQADVARHSEILASEVVAAVSRPEPPGPRTTPAWAQP